MSFRASLIWVVLAWLWASPASASCMTLNREKTPGPFETIYVCRNTPAKPVYTIVQHYVGDDAFRVFNFDPAGANIVCTDYEMGGRKMAECFTDEFSPISSRYESRRSSVEMHSLSLLKKRDREKIYRSKTIFAYPATTEEVDVEECFVHVDANRTIALGYSEKNYMALATCLIRFEEYLKTNKKFFLSLF